MRWPGAAALFRHERGSVVAEFAVAMPAVLLVLATLLAGMQVAGLQLQAQDAAADAARSWARGDGEGVVRSRLARQVPDGQLSRFRRGDMVCARVTVVPRGPISRLGLRASATACALSGGR